MNYQKQWTERDDNQPGYVYFVEAVGFGGWLPGKLLRRCKIGLTRSVQKRLDDFHSNQPCHDLRVIKSIYVEDMAEVEGELHQEFKHCNVKLFKSREWFDLNPFQFQRCLWLMNQYEREHQSFNFPSRLVTGSLIALCGVGLMVHQSLTVAPTSTNQTIKAQYQTSSSPRPIIRTKHGKRYRPS